MRRKQWTEERIQQLDEWMQEGKGLREIASRLGVPYEAAEATFHRLLLQNAVVYGEDRVIPLLAQRYHFDEEEVRLLLGAANRVASSEYRTMDAWRPIFCDTFLSVAAGAALGVLFTSVLFGHYVRPFEATCPL